MLPAGFGAPLLVVLSRLELQGQCRIWTGSVNSNGYGKTTIAGRTYYTHRIVFAYTHGWLPERPFELDHLCRVRRCARADHLEAVSHAENHLRGDAAAGETCQAGHRWDEVGWWVLANGRKCKACHRKTARESARRRATRSTLDM